MESHWGPQVLAKYADAVGMEINIEVTPIVKNAAEDYADSSISELMDALTKSTDVPGVGTLAAAAKAASTVHDAYLILKWLVFQRQFRKGMVSQEELRKWKEAAKNHEKWIQREIELLLVRIDNISEK